MEQRLRINEQGFVIVAGYAATGKSTLARSLAATIVNGVYLQKDTLNKSILTVPASGFRRLPDLSDYLKDDEFPAESCRLEITPFGERLRVPPASDFYGRHAREQGVLGMFRVARDNVKLGKVAIIDCMPIPDYTRGWVEAVINSPEFKGIPKYLIHCIAKVEVLFERMRGRLDQGDPDTVDRDKARVASLEVFRSFVTNIEPLLPPQLDNLRALILDTSNDSPDECLRKSLYFINGSDNAN